MNDKKKCLSCRKLLPLDCFHKGGGSLGKNSHCRECRKLARFGQAPHQQELPNDKSDPKN